MGRSDHDYVWGSIGWSLRLLVATKILNANAIINDVETIKQLSVINNLFSEKHFLISWEFHWRRLDEKHI